jgi:hypothetical protein
MKIEKIFSYKSEGQIWRILISETDKLVVETRDMKTREVFFHAFGLDSGKIIFSDLQLEEKNWLGIETIHNDIIYFHKFPQRDMPGHKEIIAFDISTGKILWENRDLSFLFALDNTVFGFKQGFEERYFFSLDCRSGELIKEYGSDYKTVNELRRRADDEKNWSAYLYPKIFSRDEKDFRIVDTVTANMRDVAIEGDVEYNFRGDLLCFNFNSRINDGIFSNRFLAVNLKTGEILIDEILNENSPALFTDSFFIYKNFLLLLKGKNEVIVYNADALK